MSRYFGPYRVEELIARGGMGEVSRAYDMRHDRLVALKVLSPQFAVDVDYRERFRREAHAVAKLREPHVVPIHAYGEIDGQLYLDMRLVEGEDLGARLSARGAMVPAEAADVVSQVAQALAAAHTEGIVHRDVKPSNVIVDDTGFAYLVDFGIARAIDGATGLTGTGGAIGTLDYMAPERFTGGRVDHRADIYSLACLLHQCLTGEKPFPGHTAASLVNAHLNQAPPQPSRVRGGLSPELDAVVARGMAKNPADRYSTALELAMAARQAVRGRTRGPVAVAPWPTNAFTAVEPVTQGPSTVAWLARVALVLVVGGIVVLLAWPRTSSNTGADTHTSIPVTTPQWTNPAAARPLVSSPPATSSPASSRPVPSTDELADFVIGYYRLMPDTAAGWRLVGPALRQRTRESYDRFWSKFGSADVVGRPTVAGWTVTAQIVFRYRDGRAPVIENHVLGISRCGENLCIDSDTVTKSR